MNTCGNTLIHTNLVGENVSNHYCIRLHGNQAVCGTLVHSPLPWEETFLLVHSLWLVLGFQKLRLCVLGYSYRKKN